MTDALVLAESRLLGSAGLSTADLDRVFSRLMGPGVDAADLYFQSSRSEGWMLEDGLVKEGSHSIEQGVGIRAISGEKTGFAYCDDFALPELLEASSMARAIARSGAAVGPQALARRGARALYAPVDPIETLSPEAKVDLLREVDAYARSLDPRVAQVIVSIAASLDTVLVASSDGVLAGDVRPLVRFNVQVIAEQHGRRETGSAGGGGRYDAARLVREGLPFAFAREAVRQALVNLEAVDAPAGAMTVVLGPGWPGVLLHEAVGHGLEGDFNRKGQSAYSGRIGERVAAKGVTVVDDGTIPERRGSLTVDDAALDLDRRLGRPDQIAQRRANLHLFRLREDPALLRAVPASAGRLDRVLVLAAAPNDHRRVRNGLDRQGWSGSAFHRCRRAYTGGLLGRSRLGRDTFSSRRGAGGGRRAFLDARLALLASHRFRLGRIYFLPLRHDSS